MRSRDRSNALAQLQAQLTAWEHAITLAEAVLVGSRRDVSLCGMCALICRLRAHRVISNFAAVRMHHRVLEELVAVKRSTVGYLYRPYQWRPRVRLMKKFHAEIAAQYDNLTKAYP